MDIFQPSARVGDLLNCDLVQKFKPGDETAFWKISFNGFRDQESNESPGGFHTEVKDRHCVSSGAGTFYVKL